MLRRLVTLENTVVQNTATRAQCEQHEANLRANAEAYNLYKSHGGIMDYSAIHSQFIKDIVNQVVTTSRQPQPMAEVDPHTTAKSASVPAGESTPKTNGDTANLSTPPKE
uniref:DNA-directed RNA polymerase subunit beta n=1 Tax=Lygus hesperus TaxID=30085 RepID=A0A0A9XZA6_LYGHE